MLRKEEFKKEVKVINLRFEYVGYEGEEQYAVWSELTADEMEQKYKDELQAYRPYIYLTREQGEVIKESKRNDKKHDYRNSKSQDIYECNENDIRWTKGQCISGDILTDILKKEDDDTFIKAMETLNPIQRKRVKMYIFDGLSYTEISRLEGASVQAIRKSIILALKKILKILENRV